MKKVMSKHALIRCKQQKICPDYVSREVEKLPHTLKRTKATIVGGNKVVYCDSIEGHRVIITVIGISKILNGFTTRKKLMYTY